MYKMYLYHPSRTRLMQPQLRSRRDNYNPHSVTFIRPLLSALAEDAKRESTGKRKNKGIEGRISIWM